MPYISKCEYCYWSACQYWLRCLSRFRSRAMSCFFWPRPGVSGNSGHCEYYLPLLIYLIPTEEGKSIISILYKLRREYIFCFVHQRKHIVQDFRVTALLRKHISQPLPCCSHDYDHISGIPVLIHIKRNIPRGKATSNKVLKACSFKLQLEKV